MIAIDFIKSYRNLPSYTPINISMIESMIDKMVINSIQKTGITKDIIELKQVVDDIGSPKFLKIYGDILTEMLQDIPKDYFAGKDFFDPDGNPNLRVTSIRQSNKKDKDLTRRDLNEAISTIRGLIKVAFPNGHHRLEEIINIKDPKQFLDNFADIMPEIKGGADLGDLQGHVRSMSKKYDALLKGDYSVLQGFNRSLRNVTGQILWENISLKAREKTLTKYFNEISPAIKKTFKDSGGKVLVTGRQTGNIKSNKGDSEIVDSLVTLSFINGTGTEILKISLGDSTKLSQNAIRKQRLMINATKTQSNMYSVEYLLNNLDKHLNSQFYLDYWQKRLQPYLHKAGEKNVDKNNWDNTRQAFYLLALYDVLAVRATTSGTFAQTLTINNKIQTINSVIRATSNYYSKQRMKQNNRDDDFFTIRNTVNNIFNMGIIKHSTYIQRQQKISSGNSIKDEPEIRKNYQMQIEKILSTKIAIGTNVLF